MSEVGERAKIAVLGCGNIGSAFAFQLARAGHDVTVIARPASRRLGQLQRDAGIVDVNGERADVRISDALDVQAPYDLVIVTVLAHQLPGIVPVLCRSRTSCVQFMANMFDPERLSASIGEDRCAFGMPFVQAKLDGDGRLKSAIGVGGQKTLMSRKRWVDLFNAAGLPAALEADMPLWLRCHAPMCVAFESVSVAGVRRGGGASWREASVVARGVHASFRLIRAQGYAIYPKSKAQLSRAPRFVLTAMLWSMSRVRSFRELLATGQAECVALIDVMSDACRKAGKAELRPAVEAMKPA